MRIPQKLKRLLWAFRTTDMPERMTRLERQSQEILERISAIQATLSGIALRESQLRAVFNREAELEPEEPRLNAIIASDGIQAHVTRAVARSTVHAEPFPHAIVDDVLPKELYASVLKGLPPSEVFADRPPNKRQLTVPFSLAPAYARRVWSFMADVVVPDFIVPAVIEKFRQPLDDWISANWPHVSPPSVQLHNSDGRILVRGRGYHIPPHRDPKWAFITCILYLARKQDSEAWGTRLFSVDADEEARGPSPYWIDPARCRHVTDVAFRPNRMLVLLNSVGAHGAQIPDDAPEDLERCIYQFRIAPTVESMSILKSSLSEERRPFWSGKSADY